MVKLIIPVIFVFMFFFGRLFDDTMSIEMTAPDTVNAGKDFVVEFTLKKGVFDGFSRFAQDLPLGLTATSEAGMSADFSFEENKVKLIWLKLPPESEIHFKYNISVNEYLKGEFTLEGKFSYIENNDRKTIDIPLKSIRIIPAPGVDPAKIVDISEYGKTNTVAQVNTVNTVNTFNTVVDTGRVIPSDIIPTNNPTNVYYGNVMCVRQKPERSTAAGTNGYRVNILVHKAGMEKYAKIEEQIPGGYSAVSLETQTGMFTYADQSVKFMYLVLPEKSDFVISYMLIPVAENAPEPVLNGEISYIVKNNSYTSKIVQRNENLAALDNAGIQMMIAQINKGNKTIAYSTKTKTNTVKKTYPKINKNTDAYKSYLLEPEDGVYYRVQVAAGHNPINIRSYFRRMRITEEVRSEQHDGWHKYSIGSFKDYKTARDYRVRIWNTSLVKDAFISGYNNGARVTVQEALMISNQSWLK